MTMGTAVIASLPWWLFTIAMAWRASRSRDLRDLAVTTPADPPLVSVIVPARDEARNIERCVRSVLSTAWPRLELIIVDDHSSDGTGEIARRLAAADSRVRVLVPEPLPAEWLGKQWACWTGFQVARGELLCFIDADTWQAPDLLPRAVSALYTTDSHAVTVGGIQEMRTFWEKVVQAAMFSMLVGRFGGTEVVNRSRRAEDRIANGQFMLFRRAAYTDLGGHESVRTRVAEDLALAQLGFRRGRPITVFTALDSFSTRMYASLGEIVRGWSKNIWAGGIDAAPGGRIGRLLAPFIFLLVPLMGIVPPAVLIAGGLGVVGPGMALWGALATAPALIWYAGLYRAVRQPVWYALLFPLGSLVVLWITLLALIRGRRITWKNRRYVLSG